MAGWWYSLTGEEDKANAWDGSMLPVGTDYTRASFLNQFVDRLNARAYIANKMGGYVSYMNRVQAGDDISLAENGFRETWVNIAASLSTGTGSYLVALSSVPSDGDTLPQLTHSPATVLAGYEFSLLVDSSLNVGDDFYNRLYLSKMYSILQKVRIFGQKTSANPVGVFYPSSIESTAGTSTWGARVNYYGSLGNWDEVSNEWPAVLSGNYDGWGVGWRMGTGIKSGGYARMVIGDGDWYEYNFVEVTDGEIVFFTNATYRIFGTAHVYKFAFYNDGQGFSGYDTGVAPIQNAIYKISSTAIDVSVGGTLEVTSLPTLGSSSCNITSNTPIDEDMVGYALGIYAVIEIDDADIDYE